MKILLVEDDIDLNETIVEYLENYYDIVSVYDGQDGLDLAYENNFDLFILDIKLPNINGFEIAKNIRDIKNTPIIFLTSLDTQKDLEKGFGCGADDYIKKPFSLSELKLRIDAIFKRVYGDKKQITLSNNIIFNLTNNEITKNGQQIHLKPKEMKLLKLFLQNRNQPLSKEIIFSYIYEYNEEYNEQSLRVFVNRLRNILGKEVIKTVKYIGYKFVM